MSELSRRFPKGQSMLSAALQRERIPLSMVRMDMIYTGVSWAIRVDCAAAGYRRQETLCPYDLWADTAFGELCEEIAEDLGRRIREQRAAGGSSWAAGMPPPGVLGEAPGIA